VVWGSVPTRGTTFLTARAGPLIAGALVKVLYLEYRNWRAQRAIRSTSAQRCETAMRCGNRFMSVLGFNWLLVILQSVLQDGIEEM
jgi:hypothetical protein